VWIVPPAAIVLTFVTPDSVVPFVVAETVVNVTVSEASSVSPELNVFLYVNLPELTVPPDAGILSTVITALSNLVTYLSRFV